MIPLFLLVFLQIPSISTYDFASELEILKNDLFCNQACLFDQPEITLKTMKSWPRGCGDVCGILTLNENCDLSLANLKMLFADMAFITGGIRIENTSLATLSFLPRFATQCEDFGITIANNSRLEDVGSISQLPALFSFCPLRVFNNPKLDTAVLCDTEFLENRVDLRFYGNKVDCGCLGGKMTSATIGKFVDCEVIRRNLTITDISDPPFPSKIRKIYGELIVKNTNLTSLSFLENLEVLKATSYQREKQAFINIHDNLQLRSLGFKAIKNFTNVYYRDEPFLMSLRNLHRDFCITIDEMRTFLLCDVRFVHLEGIYCKDPIPTDGPKMCVFERMSSLESDCEHILGDILIESGDEDYVDKLKTVTHVFGSITVRNTSLDNGKFLKNLRRVATLSESFPVIQFLSNKRLKQLTIPNLQHVVARINRVIFDANGPDIFEKTSDCMKIQLQGRTNVTYNGETCKAVNKTREDSVIPNVEDYDDDKNHDWVYEYEGFFYNLRPDDYQKIYDSLNGINDVTAVIGFVVNIFHLIVLFQKELRNNFIYIMMIGISICDTLLVSTFIVEYPLKNLWFYYKIDECESVPYYHVVLKILEPLTQSMTRRCSSLLAFSMALFRTCSVMFPMSGTVVSFSRPNVALSLVIGLFALCILWDFFPLMDCTITFYDFSCQAMDYSPYTYTCLSFTQPSEKDDEDDRAVQLYKVVRLIDGFFTITIGLLYILVNIVLLIQLRSAQKRRSTLKREEGESTDNTSLLVTLMAVTFFLSGVTYGSLFIINEFLLKYFSRIQSIKTSVEVAKFTLLIANSTVHCIICFSMSSQYRGVAKRIFWCRKGNSGEKSSIVVDLATISTVKTPKDSAEKTY